MSNKNPILILKHSSVSGKTPTTEQLEYGELTLNYNTKDPFLSFKDSENNIVKISANPKIVIDEELSSDSNNPVANSAITKVINENVEYFKSLLSEQPKIIIDEALSSDSINPVANSAITKVINENVEYFKSLLSEQPKIVIDEELSSDSNNPVANSAITKVIVENEETIAVAANDLNDKIANNTDLIKKNTDSIANNTASISTIKSNPVLSATTADVVITFNDESGTTETKTIYLKG